MKLILCLLIIIINMQSYTKNILDLEKQYLKNNSDLYENLETLKNEFYTYKINEVSLNEQISN